MSRNDWPSGLVTALVTPMKDDRIDPIGTRALIEQQVRAGAGGVVVAGGTGEHGALGLDERTQLARVVAEASDGRLPFIVQTGALATRDAVKLSQDAQEIGAAGLLVPAPFGEPVNWREKQAFYREINDAVSIPVMLYNTVTAGLMGVEQIQELAELSHVTALKQSSGDGTLLGDILTWSNANDFAVYIGWDDLTVPAVLGGAHGALLGAGNVVPELIVRVLDLCSRRELGAELEAAWGALRPFLRFLGTSENYVSVVKLGTRLRGVDVGDVRAPYLMPRAGEREALLRALESVVAA
ncbi:dihydrodipicolinate synthase family protein [Cryptosporangium sp. NPDC051539]|uniref:dihydrodipicolinate synthase family protein n=1 Tax=Cryptosporangium sp. NPDC051539 TaxID=3363962 RepID=UPI0037A5EB0F